MDNRNRIIIVLLYLMVNVMIFVNAFYHMRTTDRLRKIEKKIDAAMAPKVTAEADK